jgi:poly-beta-1,6-N-acetyl-D-glucosamine synthase
MALHIVVPAHNEAPGITQTIRSIHRQTHRPVSLTVIADNCTDGTADVAATVGAQIFRSVDNTHKKAGALNQYLAQRLDLLDGDDVLLVMDADTRLAPGFLEHAERLLGADRRLGAVGGVFIGDRATGWLEHFQANEYARYERDIGRHGGRVMVLTGTATAFRVRALRQVRASRGALLPGRRGEVYDVRALTEDNEMTLALKHLSWRMLSPRQCRVWTELMPTVADLHRQRLRWYRGALENLRAYGLTRVTLRYWLQQVSLALSVLVLGLLALITAVGALTGTLRLSPWWSLAGLGFVVERVVSSWRTGSPLGRALSALVLPELCYDLILQFTFLRAVLHSARGAEAAWHHPTPMRNPVKEIA